MSRITASTDFDKVPADQIPRFLVLYCNQVSQAMNNGISFQQNVDCTIQAVEFTATATDTAVIHGLGRVPTGYFPIGLSAAMIIYDGATASTTTTIYLQSSATGTANVIIF